MVVMRLTDVQLTVPSILMALIVDILYYFIDPRIRVKAESVSG